MTETKVDVYEIPTIQGLFPRMFSTMIDNGMRKGIPKELWKALAREYESLKDFNKAFHYLDAAKKFKLKQFKYSIDEYKALFNSLEGHFKNSEHSLVQGFETDEPIFVVGMPRSGTTLVERIISQHSDVTSAGELQHFGLLLKKMAKTTSNRVIDAETITASKAINFEQLGKALPKAKIICLDRDPLDTIVSNFRQLFAVNQSYYSYSYDLETTTEFYLRFRELAALWLKLYPENFYLINYEKLVNDPLTEAKQLIEFCKLSWQEQCVNIHQYSAPVATAIARQVLSPINNRSVGNWKKYDAYLDSVKEILAAKK